MLDFLRNLRLPGRSQAYRRSAQAPRRARPEPLQPRRFALGQAPRPQPKREIRIPWRRIGAVSGSLAAAGALVYGAAWLLTGDTFRVLEIDVAGAQVETPHGIAWAARVSHQSMLTVDLDAAEARVLALPGVKAAEITREWPRRVHITVTEHQAWGYWQIAGERLVIDAAGRTLQAARPAPADAPTIIELAAPRADGEEVSADPDTVRLVARLRDEGVFDRLGAQPEGYIFRRDRGLTVVMPDKPDITFGDSSNYEFKVRTLRALEERIDEAGLEAREIDLRFGRNVVLR